MRERVLALLPAVLALTTLLGAFLLFFVQPMAAKTGAATKPKERAAAM